MAKIKQISSSTENYSILPVPFWGWAGCSRRRGRCTAECTDTWLQVTGVALNQSINSLLNLGTGPESIKESRTLLSSTLLSSTLFSRPSRERERGRVRLTTHAHCTVINVRFNPYTTVLYLCTV